MATTDPLAAFWSGCEIQDWVVNPDGTRTYRQQNHAANLELQRRGDLDLLVRSGESAPYAVAWVSTCGGEWIEPPDEGVLGVYGLALYGMLNYGGSP
jgi:hypothetical protein